MFQWVVPLAFLRSMKSDPESFAAWLEGLAHHTFTIFEARDEVEDDLFLAYYEKLKSLMRKAAEQAINSDVGEQARQLLDALDKVQINKVW